MTAPLSILVVVAEPDERGSSDHLRVLVDALDRRDDVEVAVWFLRVVDIPSWWGSAREVDALRTGRLGRVARLAGPRVALGLQGLRMRWWMRQVRPDVVVLDDGLGDRILPSVPGSPTVVVRRNSEAPVRAHMEPPARDDGDVVLWTTLDPEEPAPAAHWLRTPPYLAPGRTYEPEPAPGRRPSLLPRPRGIAERAAEARAELRAAVDLDDEPLVVGWGDDGWLDGPDLFVRALWFLGERHDLRAHGVWIGLGDEPQWQERLHGEAERCGVADRFHVISGAAPSGLEWGGDAVLLPFRVPADPEVLIDCGGAGLEVVAFAPTMVDAPWVHEVPVLDVEGAAAALVGALGRDRVDVQRELDVDLWATDLVDRLRRARR